MLPRSALPAKAAIANSPARITRIARPFSSSDRRPLSDERPGATVLDGKAPQGRERRVRVGDVRDGPEARDHPAALEIDHDIAALAALEETDMRVLGQKALE